MVRSDTPNLGLDLITSTISLSEKNNIRLSPNPASEFLLVESENALTGILSLYNQNGQLVLQENFIDKLELDLTKLTNGIYILNLQSASQLYVEKLVKIK